MRLKREPLISQSYRYSEGRQREVTPLCSPEYLKKSMTYTSLQVALNANTFAVTGENPMATRGSFTVQDALETYAKRIVFDCESFQEFHERSGLDREMAVSLWEAAWENYDEKENLATGN